MNTVAVKPKPKPVAKPANKPKPKSNIVATDNTLLSVAEYRRKFFIKFARLVKGGKPFSAENFRSIGTIVSTQYIGGMWRAALTKHGEDVKRIGDRLSTVPHHKSARLPVYQGI